MAAIVTRFGGLWSEFVALATAFAAVVLLSSATASASVTDGGRLIIRESGPHHRDFSIDAVGLVNNSAFGGGASSLSGVAWYSVPVAADGFIGELNDSLDFEVGATFGVYELDDDRYTAVTPICGVKWNFHLTDDWSPFVAAKVGWELGIASKRSDLVPRVSLGTLWHVDERLSLRLETGYAGLLQIGASLPL